MPKKRFFVTIIYFVFLLIFLPVSFSAIKLPPNDGSLSCPDSPDHWDSCFNYPDCWMNGGCTTEEPIYSLSSVFDYECKFNLFSFSREYRKEKIKECKWAFCDGDTLKHTRNCGIDGDCSYSETADCNGNDGIFNHPQCSLATGGGPNLESRSCGPGEQAIADGNIYDYGCVEKGSSARCEKVGTPISCSNNLAGCHSSLNCDVGVKVDCAEECASGFMANGVCAPPRIGCDPNDPFSCAQFSNTRCIETTPSLFECKCQSGFSDCDGDRSCETVGSCKVITCGNGVIDKDEVCDGSNIPAGQTCFSRSFARGTLKCSSDCKSFDTSSCTSGCNNNNIREGNEQCDGRDLGGKTCASGGNFVGGRLTCNNDCILDWTQCITKEEPIINRCIDNDNDGFGSPASSACAFPQLDCNDNNANIKPGAAEICNDLDDNCNNAIDEGCDDDNDGFCDSSMIIGK